MNFGRLCRHSLRLFLAVSLMVGFQGMVAGPAAVATLPSAVSARPYVAAAAFEFKPALIKDPDLFGSILEDAFSMARLRPAKPEAKPQPKAAPEAYPEEAAVDPNEIIPFSGRNVPRWLVHSILKAAHVTGVDPVYMMTLADVESSLSPVAKAPTSSATGLFQFIDRTWLEVVNIHAADYGFGAAADAIRMVNGDPVVVNEEDRKWVMSLRQDPYFSALMAGELIKDVERALQAQGERELAEAELYLAHFLGAGSAVRFLEVLDENPNMSASRLFPKAAKANAGLFMDGKGRKRRAVTVAELYNRIDTKIVRRMARYYEIGPYLAEIKQPAAPTLEARADAN